MMAGVYTLQNGSLLIVSAAGIRTTTRFGPLLGGQPEYVATTLRDLADFVERAGNATAPLFEPSFGRSET